MADSQLKDAHKQMQDLKAELYSVRKSQREAQQQRDTLGARVQDLQHDLQEAQQQSWQVPGLEKALAEASASMQALEQEVQSLRDGLSTVSLDLETERSKRARAQEAKERADADRLRLQRARDELAKNIMAAERRAQEAEEEELRIEQESQAELRSLRARLSEADSLRTEALPNGHPEDESQLLQEVEMERRRAAVLVTALNSAKQERDEAQRQLQELRAELPARSQPGSAPPGLPKGVPLDPAIPNGQHTAQLSRPSSSGQISSLDGEGPSTETLEALQRQVGRLKAARDKLLTELDEQVEETERLASENASLTQALMDARKLCGAWENQTNDSLMQIDRLKDLIEESAMWQSPSKPPRPNGAMQTGGGLGSPGISGGRDVSAEQSEIQAEEAPGTSEAAWQAATHLEQLEAQLMRERARGAQLDLHLRALAAEVTRTSGVTSDLRNSVLPMLTGVESRLSQLLKITPSSLQTAMK